MPQDRVQHRPRRHEGCRLVRVVIDLVPVEFEAHAVEHFGAAAGQNRLDAHALAAVVHVRL